MGTEVCEFVDEEFGHLCETNSALNVYGSDIGGELTRTTSGRRSSSAETEGMATAFRRRSMNASDSSSTFLKYLSSWGAIAISLATCAGYQEKSRACLTLSLEPMDSWMVLEKDFTDLLCKRTGVLYRPGVSGKPAM